jgi:hypothetical protein
MVALNWALEGQAQTFADWRGPIGDEESQLSTEDFADLRLATATESEASDGLRAQIHFDRGSHLFRYNRV